MSGSQTTAGIPAEAAAVGYDTETFGPAINVGTTPNPTTSYPQFINGANVVPYQFTGTSWTNIGETNSNGSVTLNGTGEAFGNGLATASVTAPGQTLNGIAFGGGGYFQVTMSGNGPMSFWMNDAETMNGVSNGTGADPQDSWMEADIAEFDTTGVYGFALHNWYGAVGSGNEVNTGAISGSPVSPPGANYSQPNTYGLLWVPATATTQGYAKFYFNGTQVGNTITWNQYVPGQSAADNPYAVMDELHMVPILGAGSGSTVTFSNLEVWQASASNDIGTDVAAAPTPTPTPTPTATPSANDTVVHAGSSDAITDTSGNAWTITTGGQVAVNGTADTTTGNVTELAYVNGEVWQENAGGYWWGKTSPTAAWSPGAGTTTSPLPSTSTPTPTPTATPSANDTVVHAGSSSAITDTSGNAWTITTGGQVAVNGTADTTTGNVTELAYVNGEVWQENAGGYWWGKTSPTAAWSPGAGTTTSPLPSTSTPTPTPTATPSANDTVVYAGSSSAITDSRGNAWTITMGGQVAVNGTADTTTGNVTELAYVNGEVWQENAGGYWWGKTSPTAAWSPGAGTTTSPLPAASTPTPTPTPTPAPTPTPTPNEITPTSGGTLTDSAGNQWTLTSAGVVQENGVAVPGGSGTAAFAIVSNVLYGQDATSKAWFTYSTASQYRRVRQHPPQHSRDHRHRRLHRPRHPHPRLLRFQSSMNSHPLQAEHSPTMRGTPGLSPLPVL